VILSTSGVAVAMMADGPCLSEVPMSPLPGSMQVYQAGPTTVIGFGGVDVVDDINLAACRDELAELLRKHETQVLALDLTGVRLIPSGLLGLLASLRNSGREVRIVNPSDDVREVLAITHFDRLVTVCELNVDA
jgi:anti-anti-sigma factor